MSYISEHPAKILSSPIDSISILSSMRGIYLTKLSSFIQTLLSASEFHRINACALAGFTAGREFHPALKIVFIC